MTGPLHYRERFRFGANAVELTLEREKVDPTRLRFTTDKDGATLLDGRLRVVGVDGVPKARGPVVYQLRRMELRWNGRAVPLSNGTYQFVLNPSLVPKLHSLADEGSVLVVPDPIRSKLLVQVSGGDGAASYTVWWVLTANGCDVWFVEGAP